MGNGKLSQVAVVSPWVSLPRGVILVNDIDRDVTEVCCRPNQTCLGPISSSRLVGLYDRDLSSLDVKINNRQQPFTIQQIPPVEGKRGILLWRVCVEMAEFLDQQVKFHTESSSSSSSSASSSASFQTILTPSFINPSTTNSNSGTDSPNVTYPSKPIILELGAGTGLLSMVAADIAHRLYVTDQEEVLKLTQRNIMANLPASTRHRIVTEPWHWGKEKGKGIGPTISKELGLNFSQGRQIIQDSQYDIDIILISDCVYDEESVNDLTKALNVACKNRQSQTVVLIAIQLRDIDMIRTFLHTLQKNYKFQIFRIPGSIIDRPKFDESFVLYAALAIPLTTNELSISEPRLSPVKPVNNNNTNIPIQSRFNRHTRYRKPTRRRERQRYNPYSIL